MANPLFLTTRPGRRLFSLYECSSTDYQDFRVKAPTNLKAIKTPDLTTCLQVSEYLRRQIHDFVINISNDDTSLKSFETVFNTRSKQNSDTSSSINPLTIMMLRLQTPNKHFKLEAEEGKYPIDCVVGDLYDAKEENVFKLSNVFGEAFRLQGEKYVYVLMSIFALFCPYIADENSCTVLTDTENTYYNLNNELNLQPNQINLFDYLKNDIKNYTSEGAPAMLLPVISLLFFEQIPTWLTDKSNEVLPVVQPQVEELGERCMQPWEWTVVEIASPPTKTNVKENPPKFFKIQITKKTAYSMRVKLELGTQNTTCNFTYKLPMLRKTTDDELQYYDTLRDDMQQFDGCKREIIGPEDDQSLYKSIISKTAGLNGGIKITEFLSKSK